MADHSNHEELDSCTLECRKTREELKRFEARYDEKVHEFELIKLTFNNTMSTIARDVKKLEKTNVALSAALNNHMKEEETHHLNVATALAKIEALLEGKPTTEDIQGIALSVETQKGRINTIWLIGGTVVVAALATMALMAVYIKDDLSNIIKPTVDTAIHKPKVEFPEEKPHKHKH